MKEKLSRFVFIAGIATRKFSRLVVIAGVTTITTIGFSSLTTGTKAQEGRKSKDDRPNIVLLIADDMGYNDLGSFGSEISTPNIDALAKQGMALTNFHVGPACSPSRSMILTGVDNHLAGLGTMPDRISANQKGKPGYETYLNKRVVTFADLLKDGGYHTYMVGKWHMGNEKEYWPSSRGFQQSFAMLHGEGNHYNMNGMEPSEPVNTFVENDKTVDLPKDFYSTKNYTDKMIEFIEKNRKDGKPFAAYMAYTAPHAPFQAPKEYIQKYLGKYDVGWDKIREQRFKRMQQLGLIPDYVNLPPRWSMVKAWDQLSPEEKRMESKKMAIYAAMIDYLDMSIGRFIKYLKDIGEYDNTIFIFLSDNGGAKRDVSMGAQELLDWMKKTGYDNSYENIGNANSCTSFSYGWAQVITTPFWTAKGAVAEGGIRAPFIVAYPKGIKPGTMSRAFANVRDLTPTFLDYAGVRNPGNKYKGNTIYPIEGKSMRSLWEGRTDRVYGENEPVGFELYGKVNKALILGDWKILRLGDEQWGNGENEKWKLFNLAVDPTEMNDLSALYPQQLQKMISLYEEYEKRVGVVPFEAAETKEVKNKTTTPVKVLTAPRR